MPEGKDIAEEAFTLFMGNLLGNKVRDAFIPKKRHIRGKVFAFVRMKDDSQASQAIVALNGSTYENKKLLVKRAQF